MEKNNNHYQVSCFVYYMANVWCKSESIRVFGEIMGEHFWMKYCEASGDANSSTLQMYFELSAKYREMLVTAAIEHYESKGTSWIDYQ